VYRLRRHGRTTPQQCGSEGGAAGGCRTPVAAGRRGAARGGVGRVARQPSTTCWDGEASGREGEGGGEEVADTVEVAAGGGEADVAARAQP